MTRRRMNDKVTVKVIANVDQFGLLRSMFCLQWTGERLKLESRLEEYQRQCSVMQGHSDEFLKNYEQMKMERDQVSCRFGG